MREHPLCHPGNHLGTGPGCSRPGQRGGVSVRLCTSTHKCMHTNAVHTQRRMHACTPMQRCMHACTPCRNACTHMSARALTLLTHTHAHMHTHTQLSLPSQAHPTRQEPCRAGSKLLPGSPRGSRWLQRCRNVPWCRDIPQDPAGSCPALCCVSCRSKLQGANGCPVPSASPSPTGRELTPLQGK